MFSMDYITLNKMEMKIFFFSFSLIVATLGQDIKYLRVFSLPAETHIHMYLQGSIHAVSSFRVLTDGRLTAVCPRNGKIPPKEVQATQFEELRNLQRTKYKARSNRICCELNSTGTFEKDLFEKTFLLSVFELKKLWLITALQ